MKNIHGSYLDIQNLSQMDPDMASSSPLGFVDRGKGGTYFLNTGKEILFTALLELTPAGGVRGRHRHRLKEEILYVISGEVSLTCWMDREENASEYILLPGMVATIKPGLFHALRCIGGSSLVLELSPQLFDLSDHEYPDHS